MSLPPYTIDTATVLPAVAAIALHVANYNATARLEFNSHAITKVLGRNAVYFYAVYLVASALVRDWFIDRAMAYDAGSLILLPSGLAWLVGNALLVTGFGINLWTLKALGIKNMYNGDSFGHLMDAPVNDGPYQLWNDPQYFGTSLACLGHAVALQSGVGYALAAIMWCVFEVSVRNFEGPHLARIYANRDAVVAAARAAWGESDAKVAKTE
ncbi:phospholipid methyltransferase-domain-containing protein [Blastocladiella britannica]|nr:phospholipid methyltransferase-domain-containing protein [Blastocladiella britannica]